MFVIQFQEVAIVVFFLEKFAAVDSAIINVVIASPVKQFVLVHDGIYSRCYWQISKYTENM